MPDFIYSLRSPDKREVLGGEFVGEFLPANPDIDILRTDTDARFPYEVRQNVVIGLVVAPLWEQEVPGSNPGARLYEKNNGSTLLCRAVFYL